MWSRRQWRRAMTTAQGGSSGSTGAAAAAVAQGGGCNGGVKGMRLGMAAATAGVAMLTATHERVAIVAAVGFFSQPSSSTHSRGRSLLSFSNDG